MLANIHPYTGPLILAITLVIAFIALVMNAKANRTLEDALTANKDFVNTLQLSLRNTQRTASRAIDSWGKTNELNRELQHQNTRLIRHMQSSLAGGVTLSDRLALEADLPGQLYVRESGRRVDRAV